MNFLVAGSDGGEESVIFRTALCWTRLDQSDFQQSVHFRKALEVVGQRKSLRTCFDQRPVISEGARPQLVLPQRGADRQALPALTSDSGRDPGKPRHKPRAERLALLPKTAERKQHRFLCQRPE